MNVPNLFIVGAPKCGTTAMHNYLGQHPQIFMLPLPERHFFGSDLNYWWFPKLTETEYRELFSEAGNVPVIGEKSASYLASERAAGEIKTFSPDAKIIVMLRNPVDMLYALHSEMLRGGCDSIADFEQAITIETERRLGPRERWADSDFVNARFYMESTRYATQLDRYFETFGRERVHVILFEDLRRDTLGVCRETLRFLEVDIEFQPQVSIVNANKALRSARLMYPPDYVRAIARTVIPRWLRSVLRQGIQSINTVQRSRQEMDPGLRRQLQSAFAPEVEKLATLIERDLTAWQK